MNVFVASRPSSRCGLPSGRWENPSRQRTNQVVHQMMLFMSAVAFNWANARYFHVLALCFSLFCHGGRSFCKMRLSSVSVFLESSCLCNKVYLKARTCLFSGLWISVTTLPLICFLGFFVFYLFPGTLWWRSCLNRTMKRRALPRWYSTLWSR